MLRASLIGMVVLSVLCGVARADKLSQLDRATRDGSWRVRLQATSVLSKIKDPRAVSLLERLLQDKQETVRKAAALALAKQRSGSAERQRAREDVLVKIGGVGAKARSVRPEMTRELRSLLEREFAHTPGILINGQPVQGYLIDSSIVAMDRKMTHDFVEVSVEISVIVGRWPSKAMVMMTSGGATVQEPKTSYRADRAGSLESDALEGAVKGAHENLMSYLRTH